jgi:hypothetical protein
MSNFSGFSLLIACLVGSPHNKVKLRQPKISCTIITDTEILMVNINTDRPSYDLNP